MPTETLGIGEVIRAAVLPPSTPDPAPASTGTAPWPVYAITLEDSGNQQFGKRLLVGTAATGLVRWEWVQAYRFQTIPPNFSKVDMDVPLSAFVPMRFMVDDAQNLICAEAVKGQYEWLLLYEHDVIPPIHAYMLLNQYMRDMTVPVVSGLYFTRNSMTEPLIYRGRGNSYYKDWQPGDRVWADGVPTGFLLIHCSIIRAMWNESEEYTLPGRAEPVRRIFYTPQKTWFDEATGTLNVMGGTSDLRWCDRVMEGRYFEKAGWPEYQSKQYPFLVDTAIFCRHIEMNGIQYPHYWQSLLKECTAARLAEIEACNRW